MHVCTYCNYTPFAVPGSIPPETVCPKCHWGRIVSFPLIPGGDVEPKEWQELPWVQT
jgi:hypothetical protein